MANIEISAQHIDALVVLFKKEEQEADRLIREAMSKKHAAAEMLQQLYKLKNDILYVSRRYETKHSASAQHEGSEN